MRVLRVHNRYQERGGEDASFEAECNLLEQRGHPLMRLEFDNHQIPEKRSLRSSVGLGISTVWSKDGTSRVEAAVASFEPDIVHFDNTFPLVSPAAYSACQRAGVPVVQSLRNYRLLCPSATFFRDGHVCEDCLGKKIPWPGVAHACYRDSHVQTSTVAAMTTFHRIRRTWDKDVDRYIALTEFARLKFQEGGVPPDRIVVKPNFADGISFAQRAGRDGFIFVGRLSEEKGIDTLLDACVRSDSIEFVITGDGPLRPMVEAFANTCDRVTYTGRLASSQVIAMMGKSQALIFPSRWYETFGRVAMEAFACGTPVIASNLGAMAEIVDDHRTGLLFEPGNAHDLAAKIRWANDHPEKMCEYGLNARREYEQKYTAQRNYEMLMDIYQQATERRRTHPPARWPR